MSQFNTDDVEVDWPESGNSYRNGKMISYDSRKVTVNNPYAGFFAHITIENDDYLNRDNLAVQVPSNAAIYIMGRTFNTFTKVSGTTVTIQPDRNIMFYFQARSTDDSVFILSRASRAVKGSHHGLHH